MNISKRRLLLEEISELLLVKDRKGEYNSLERFLDGEKKKEMSLTGIYFNENDAIIFADKRTTYFTDEAVPTASKTLTTKLFKNDKIVVTTIGIDSTYRLLTREYKKISGILERLIEKENLGLYKFFVAFQREIFIPNSNVFYFHIYDIDNDFYYELEISKVRVKLETKDCAINGFIGVDGDDTFKILKNNV